jgi:hypothetical protein
MTQTANFRICGLAVTSELDLRGAIRNCSAPVAVDVLIRRGHVPESLAYPTETGPDWQMAGNDGFLFRVPGLARFLVTKGHAITVEVEPGAVEDDVSGFVLGTAFGMLLHQRGLLVLHGSAVAKNGQAIAICGESGAGKSTLAAALCLDGCSFVTDDLCVVAQNEIKRPVVLPDGRKLKLWKETIDELDLSARQGEAVRQPFEKYYIEPFNAASAPPVLSAIFILRDAQPAFKKEIERLALPDAMRALENEMYRPGLRQKMGLRSELVAHAAATIGHANVFLLTRPRGFEHLDETVALVRVHWASSEV